MWELIVIEDWPGSTLFAGKIRLVMIPGCSTEPLYSAAKLLGPSKSAADTAAFAGCRVLVSTG
jgi:hypothetical protein